MEAAEEETKAAATGMGAVPTAVARQCNPLLKPAEEQEQAEQLRGRGNQLRKSSNQLIMRSR